MQQINNSVKRVLNQFMIISPSMESNLHDWPIMDLEKNNLLEIMQHPKEENKIEGRSLRLFLTKIGNSFGISPLDGVYRSAEKTPSDGLLQFGNWQLAMGNLVQLDDDLETFFQ